MSAKECNTCNGTGLIGSVEWIKLSGKEQWAFTDKECPDCEGEGEVHEPGVEAKELNEADS